jgi:hypothetical protein
VVAFLEPIQLANNQRGRGGGRDSREEKSTKWCVNNICCQQFDSIPTMPPSPSDLIPPTPVDRSDELFCRSSRDVGQHRLYHKCASVLQKNSPLRSYSLLQTGYSMSSVAAMARKKWNGRTAFPPQVVSAPPESAQYLLLGAVVPAGCQCGGTRNGPWWCDLGQLYWCHMLAHMPSRAHRVYVGWMSGRRGFQ